MYMSSGTYYNWYNENSNLNNLPVIAKKKDWNQFESIDTPILTFSGSKEKDYYLQLDLLKEKAINCPDFEYQIIANTGHTYYAKEKEIGELILSWTKNKFNK